MEAVTTAIILGLLLIVLYKYLKSPKRYWEKFNVPSVKETSVWDSLLETFNNKLHELDIERMKKYGRIYGFFVFGQPNLMISDPSLIRDILVKDFQNFRNTQDFSRFTSKNDFANHMMFVIRDEKWKRIRTVISPVFTTGKIKKVLSHVTESSKTLLKNFANSSKSHKSIDVKKYYEAFAMDMIASVAFATKIDSHNDPQNAFVVNARRFFNNDINFRFLIILLFPRLIKLFNISVLDSKASNFFKNVILKVIEQRKQKNEKHNDFIQLMMDASDEAARAQAQAQEADKTSERSETEGKFAPKINKVLSPDELMSNSIMFFFVAFGTSSLTLSFLSYLLALNPDCQEKLIEEVDDTLRNNGMEFTYDAIQNMKYMDMVFSETLRLYPVAIRTDREAELDYDLKGKGIKIPRKTTVSIPIYAIQHDPEFFPDPEKFDPDRFSPEECAKRDPYTYIPFSAGPRNCIGMRFALFEMKTCLAYTLSRFRFKRCPETSVPLNVETRAQGIMTVAEINLLVEERADKLVKDID